MKVTRGLLPLPLSPLLVHVGERFSAWRYFLRSSSMAGGGRDEMIPLGLEGGPGHHFPFSEAPGSDSLLCPHMVGGVRSPLRCLLPGH